MTHQSSQINVFITVAFTCSKLLTIFHSPVYSVHSKCAIECCAMVVAHRLVADIEVAHTPKKVAHHWLRSSCPCWYTKMSSSAQSLSTFLAATATDTHFLHIFSKYIPPCPLWPAPSSTSSLGDPSTKV